VAEGLCQVRLADAGRTDDEDVVVPVDEGAGRQLEHLGLRDGRVEGEVEVLDGLRVVEGCAA
jgi:hypothetical protein